MKYAPRFIPLLALVVATAMLAGCAQKVQEPPTPPPAPPRDTTPAEPAPTPEPTPPPPAPPQITSSDFQPVFFDYDSHTLRPDARAALDGNARVLRDNPDVRLMIEGHCDERGTIEYNLALGERRANAARDYLINAGIAGSRLTSISYGKERPFDTGSGETAWAKNRRAHFVLQ